MTTVQQLIDILQKVEDKELPIEVGGRKGDVFVRVTKNSTDQYFTDGKHYGQGESKVEIVSSTLMRDLHGKSDMFGDRTAEWEKRNTYLHENTYPFNTKAP